MEQKGSNPRNTPSPPNRYSNWMIVLWILLIWMLVSYGLRSYQTPQVAEISYTRFKEEVQSGNVAEVTIEGQKISGKFEKPVAVKAQGGTQEASKADASKEGGESSKEAPKFQSFKTTKPPMDDPKLLRLLEENNVTIHAKSQEQPWLVTLLVNLLPWLLLIGFFVYMGRRMQQRMGGGMGGPFGFGKSKAKIYHKSTTDVSFDDVAGMSNAKKELQEVVDFLKDPSRYQSLGGTLPKGLLLVGPPGTGKTLLARAVAGEADVAFYSISGSEFIEMFVGVGASRVRDMFKNAKEEAPAIIFIDEIDSIGRVRGTGLGGGHDEREQTLNQILNEMDGFSPHESVVVMAATNRPDVLDPALVRPGRFDRQVRLELPHKRARKEILEIHTKNVPLADDVDLEQVAKRCVGFSGADLHNLVNEAAILAARKGKETVSAEDFDQGRDKILMGIEREEVINEDEREMIAYHEAGHALTTKLLPGTDPLEKVTIIPRGRALGATEQMPEEDRHNLSRGYLFNRIAIMLGGRVSEKLTFDDISSGAGDDLKNATQLARRMVCQWGMSEKLGPVAFQQGDPHPFLGREMTEQKDYSERTAQVIDEEIQRIISEMEERTRQLLESNQDKLNALAQALLEEETLTNEEVDEIIGVDTEKKEENRP